MNLAYLIVLDTPGSGGNRLMAKMLAMSLVRNQFDGDILIFHSGATPIFQLPRPGILEAQLPVSTEGLEGRRLAEEAWTWKYRVADAVAEHAEAIGAEKILYLDSDILCLKNPDILLEGNWDIGVVREPGRSHREIFYNAYLSEKELDQLSGRAPANAGTFAVRRECYQVVMSEWAAIHQGPAPANNPAPCDQCAWNRLILDTDKKVKSIEPDAVMFPLNMDFDFRRYREATLVHCLGDGIEGKVKFLFGLYMTTFFFDESGTLLHLLDM